MADCPLYLKKYESTWKVSPRDAKKEWFKDAKYGLFLHYGLYSMLGRGEWVMYYEKIHVAEYEKLQMNFTAHNFDAEKITDMAIKAGMKYITITTCHHEGFCLWDCPEEPFNSVNSPCGRDLIRELSEACDRKGLGFFAYYTFMLNWRHPYYVTRKEFIHARPDYAEPEPRYLYKNKEDFQIYLDYIARVMDDLLSRYKITGIWLDLVAAWFAMGEEYIPIKQIYADIRKKHPDMLISWKMGATGDEDFAAPEFSFGDPTEGIRAIHGDAGAARANFAYNASKGKHNEVCSTVQDAWGFNAFAGVKTAEQIITTYKNAMEHDCNLLLNVGPLGDGSISPIQEKLLYEVAEKLGLN